MLARRPGDKEWWTSSPPGARDPLSVNEPSVVHNIRGVLRLSALARPPARCPPPKAPHLDELPQRAKIVPEMEATGRFYAAEYSHRSGFRYSWSSARKRSGRWRIDGLRDSRSPVTSQHPGNIVSARVSNAGGAAHHELRTATRTDMDKVPRNAENPESNRPKSPRRGTEGWKERRSLARATPRGRAGVG